MNKKNTPVYDAIGKTYDSTRKADPRIVKQLFELLEPKASGHYLDVGCGSANYTGALAEKGLDIQGIDISSEMLTKARKKYPNLIFHQADAKTMLFPDRSFDGVSCVLAMHHMGDNAQLFREVFRVIKKGRFVIFTMTPEQIEHYWLCHYFPEMMIKAKNFMTSFDELKYDLQQAGFRNVQKLPFFIPDQLQDLFLHAGKYRPEIYLDAAVREGISTFHLFANSAELMRGLEQLRKDIESGEIQKIIANYETNAGDLLFVVAERNSLLPCVGEGGRRPDEGV